ncbi:MAG TPA: HAMP domain-containing sensor histidine kinase [candidate division Zixibacteria bacterium]|nr:HAMP domain-containing sensor histidine kinase [candidate division Zixibacteria bacterium]
MMTQESQGAGALGRQGLIILFAVALTVAVNLFWWLYYDTTERQFAAQLDRRLSSLAIAGAAVLGPREADSLVAGAFDPYLTLYDFLERLAATDTVSEIFAVDLAYSILVTTALESDSMYLLAGLNREALERVFNAADDTAFTGAVVTEDYIVGEVILKTAFAPLYGSDGAVIGAVGVEADVNYGETLSALKSNLTYASAISVLAAGIFAVLFLLIHRRVTNAERLALRSESESNLGRMVAVVSHEIKNPLAILRSAAERIQKKTEMPEAQYLTEEVDRLNKIVTGYLDFARSPDRVTLQFTPVEEILRELRTVATQLRPRLEADGVSLTTLIPPATAELSDKSAFVDTAALRQITMNLLLNGADAARQAAAQEKHAGREPEVRLTIECSANRLWAHVMDNGLGIPLKSQKKLFEPFYTTKQHGSGLGLYLSRRLIERMKGTITVRSSDSGPTEFTIELPLTGELSGSTQLS